MVKDPKSAYTPGRRGLGWLKMKKALATIDCVVVGVEVGHGKRHGVLSDYTFAVRDEANDRLVNIGKAYSGLTDAEIAEMTDLVRGAHDRAVRALPAGRADRRRGGRLRRDHALDPPPVRVRAPVPAHRAPATRQAGRRDRHPRHRRAPVRGPPVRRRTPGDRQRQTMSGSPFGRLSSAESHAYPSRHVRPDLGTRGRGDPVHRRVRHQWHGDQPATAG